jgi:sec-independent protein translocase protein TatC
MVRLGVASVARLRQARPYVIVGAFVVAAIFTPPDVLSQLLLALPLWLLFELGVLLAALFGVSRTVSDTSSGPAAG